MYVLRFYQLELINAIRQAIGIGHRSILSVAPTGSGKTVIFAYIAASAAAKGKSVLVLVHRSEIFGQTMQKLHDFGIAAGQVAAGKIMTRNPIKVGMVQTVANRLAAIDPPDLIIIDEGHHGTAPTWLKIFQAFPGAIRLFYTATPERADGRGLGDVCDYMVESWSLAKLVAEGYLVIPRVLQPNPESIPEYHVTRGDFDKKEQLEYMSKPVIVGNVIDYHRQYLRHKPTISFVASLAHGATMEKVYRDAGITAKLIQGGQKHMAERRRTCLELADGTTEILISCDVVSEGFDLPVVAGCHLLRRTMSLGLNDQQMGRTLRPVYAPGYDLDTKAGRLAAIAASDKPCSYILDFVGNSFLHPHPLQPRNWSLESTKRDPRKTKPNITRCPRCGGVWPGKPAVCLNPACGYRFAEVAARARAAELDHVAGGLREAIPGLTSEDVEGLARVFSQEDKGRRQRLMMSHAYKAYGEGDKKKLRKLAEWAGYSKKWVTWAWNYVQKKRGKSA